MIDPVRPPPLPRLLGETACVGDWWTGRRYLNQAVGRKEGNGQCVLVIPGFLASDWMTALLRRALEARGHAAHGWMLGRNLGLRPGLVERLEARFAALRKSAGRPIVVVGWSLGGLYARELAKRRPHDVACVITLGSPFSGDIRANRAWRLYERVAGHPVDRPPVMVELSCKPPVPTIAIWTRRDGIVAPATTAGRPEERDLAIEVDCTHIGLVCAPSAISAVLDVLDGAASSFARG